METFNLKVIASNRIFYDGPASSLVIPSADGLMGFMANHENYVVPVELGEMKIVDGEGKSTIAFIEDGFLEFIDNTATLVCISAELPEEIDERRAREAQERAEEQLRQKQSILEYNHSQANLARAMERLKIKTRYRV